MIISYQNYLNKQDLTIEIEDFNINSLGDIYTTNENIEKAIEDLKNISESEDGKGSLESSGNLLGEQEDNRELNSHKVWSIIKDLKQHKASEIIGKSIDVDNKGIITDKGWIQLNQILKIYRNKSFETFRFVVIDKSGNINEHKAVTARMPTVSGISPSENGRSRQ